MPELHVDREMNVWGKRRRAHELLQKNRRSNHRAVQQSSRRAAKGIVDMGCGNGAFLQHIFEVISQRTLRGEMLEDYPLLLVGADFNEVALRVTRANLTKADIWAKGHLGKHRTSRSTRPRPQRKLRYCTGRSAQCSHFPRSQSQWEEPAALLTDRVSQSTGAYSYRGKRLNNNAVEAGLLEHFRRWEPFVRRFGLLVIELHTIAPKLAAANIGLTSATAYDATHGYSDQYILEVDVFNRIAGEAGLYPDPAHFFKFPPIRFGHGQHQSVER